jgi:hypothetical protein
MIPMSELVKDPVYRKFLETQPVTPKISRNPKLQKSPPWVVYVQKEPYGKWGKKEFWKYSEAFHFLRRCLKAGVADATINNKRVGFEPPMRYARIKGRFIIGSDGQKRQATKAVPWQPKLLPEDEEHHWCRHCRRPTVFKYFRRHKALHTDLIDTTVPRCCICGASARIALSRDDRLFRNH